MIASNSSAERTLLRLSAAVLNSITPEPLPESIPPEELIAVAKRQDMLPLLFCAVNTTSPTMQSTVWDSARDEYFRECMRSEIQMAEFDSLSKFLCSHSVQMIPLKGIVLKQLYPEPFLRGMSDVDFLYEGVTPEQLASLMESRGYTTERLGLKREDIFRRAPFVIIEAHRKLLWDDSPYRGCLDRLFDRAIPDSAVAGYYHLRPEDMVLHVIVHAAHHLKGGGIGIRPLTDLYVLHQAYGSALDHEYVEEALRSVGLFRFAEKMRELSKAFFSPGEYDVPDNIIDFLFRAGAYGDVDDQSWKYYTAAGEGRTTFLTRKLFPSFTSLSGEYPILERFPVLLPFIWLYRIADVLLRRSWSITRILRTKISEKDRTYALSILKEFGLDS